MKDYVLEQKRSVVSEIKDRLENSTSLVIVDYRGLTVDQVTELRNQYRNSGVVYKVYKNTMVKLALKELGIEGLDEYLEGPSAFAFSSEDATAAARVSNNFSKINEKLEIKVGMLEGKVLTSDEVKEVANIPSREVLLARLLGSFKAPVSNFAYLVSAIAKKKEEEVA